MIPISNLARTSARRTFHTGVRGTALASVRKATVDTTVLPRRPTALPPKVPEEDTVTTTTRTLRDGSKIIIRRHSKPKSSENTTAHTGVDILATVRGQQHRRVEDWLKGTCNVSSEDTTATLAIDRGTQSNLSEGYRKETTGSLKDPKQTSTSTHGRTQPSHESGSRRDTTVSLEDTAEVNLRVAQVMAKADGALELVKRLELEPEPRVLETRPAGWEFNLWRDSPITTRSGSNTCSSIFGERAAVAKMREMESSTSEVGTEERRRLGILDTLGTTLSLVNDSLSLNANLEPFTEKSQPNVVESRTEVINRKVRERLVKMRRDIQRSLEAEEACDRHQAQLEEFGRWLPIEMDRIAEECDRRRDEEDERYRQFRVRQYEEMRKRVEGCPCCSGRRRAPKAVIPPLLQPQPFRLARPGYARWAAEQVRREFPDDEFLEMRPQALKATQPVDIDQASHVGKGEGVPRRHPSQWGHLARPGCFAWAVRHVELLEEAEANQQEHHSELLDAPVYRTDCGPKVDDGLDDATFLTHQDWEQRFEEAASRRKEQQHVEETEDERSTGIFETLRGWATGLWKTIKKTVWG